MKIVIDTKTDSVEEIQKAIQILSSLIGQQAASNQDLFSSEIKPVETGVFNIFGNIEPKTGNETINAIKKDENKEDRNIDLLDLEEYR